MNENSKLLLSLFVVFFISSIYLGLAPAFLLVLSLIAGWGVSKVMWGKYANIYPILFVIGCVYLVMCYVYMQSHNYSWLLAIDADEVFVPFTAKYLSSGNGDFIKTLGAIFSDFNFFDQTMYGYWVYSTFWGIIAGHYNIDLYLALQVSTLFMYPFAGVLLKILLERNGIPEDKSSKYSLIICVFSIIFFYSSQILRDIHILVFYLSAIEISSRQKFSISDICKLILLVVVTSLFRIESGLFLCVLIPVYLLVTLRYTKHFSLLSTFSIIVVISMTYVSFLYSNSLFSLAKSTYDGYIGNVQDGNGIIAMLQRIPVIGGFFSILYTAVQPIPFWRLLSANGNPLGGEAYNILGITRATASYMNVVTVVAILRYIFGSEVKSEVKGVLTPALKYQVWIGLAFIYIQSAVVDQRRIMGFYCVFYVLFFVIYSKVNPNIKKNIMLMSFIVYFILQLCGMILFK